MADTLVIVESPAKAKTIEKYLGKGYTVRASMGHVRDLPQQRLGVDTESGTFEPEYETVRGRGQTLSQIRELAKGATTVLLATDPDREGEAIAWHLAQAVGLGRGRQQVGRVEFHEITANAVRNAIANPRALDMNLVNAQQARRVLDRLVGYKLSPLLRHKITVNQTLSAGRVQSVALRVVVEREREIEAFVPREFWTVEADLAKSPWSKRKQDIFRASLVGRKNQGSGGRGQGSDDAKTPQKKWEFENGEAANAVVAELEGGKWKVAKVTRKEAKRYPAPPFTTSTLQQEASRKLRFPTKLTMQIAQQLYEGVSLGPEGHTGLITYMRTDSFNVAYEAQMAARPVIEQQFGPEYLPEKPPHYTTKSKGAQEAHEAIRPTNPARQPDNVKNFLTAEQYKLYRLIWQRFIASQMSPARVELTTVEIEAQPRDLSKSPYLFRATGERIIFPGFLAVYREGRGDSDELDEEKGLPALDANDPLDLLKLLAEQHFTQPPPRFGEATLVKALEELGVGRPSTYSTILATIQDRGYVVIAGEGKEKKFQPTGLGRAVNDLLVARFPDLLDVQFTAKLESELDEVAEGKRQWVPLVAGVYTPMMARLALAEREVGKITLAAEDMPPPSTARKTSRSYGKGGSYKRSNSRPKTAEKEPVQATTKVATTERATSTRTRKAATPKTVSAQPPSTTTATITCEKCGKAMVKRKGPYGEFYGCTGYPNCRNIRKLA